MSIVWPLATTAVADAGELFGEVWPWLAALVAVVAVGAVVIYLLRRSLGRSGPGAAEGFTLQELRDLRASGALSDEEFERAKAAVIGHLTREETPPQPAREPDDSESGA
jgi:hypothetical protein